MGKGLSSAIYLYTTTQTGRGNKKKAGKHNTERKEEVQSDRFFPSDIAAARPTHHGTDRGWEQVGRGSSQNFPDGLLDLPSENTHVMLTGICLRPQSIRHQAWTRTKIQAEQFKGGTSAYMYMTIYAPCGVKP